MKTIILILCFILTSVSANAQIKIPQKTTVVQAPQVQTTGVLKIICGADGELLIDGESKGSVAEFEIKKFTVKAGKLIVQLKPNDGRKMVTEIVNLTAGKEEAIELNPEAKTETKYNSSLLVETTLTGTLKINGEVRGIVNSGSPSIITLNAGINIIEISSLDGKYILKETIESKSSTQGYKKFDLLEQKKQEEAAASSAEEARLASEAQRVKAIRLAEEARLASEAQRVEAIRLAEEQRKETEQLFLAIEKNMVSVAGGSFTMGCTSEQSDCDADERPKHSVTLSSYSIGKYEVTQAQWKAVMGDDPSYSDCDNCPVEQVSWDDIQGFISKLNNQTGKSYRLPTEAEWEYAARGGNKSQGYKYAGNNDAGSVAWYNANSSSNTNPVGQKTPNELGIYDMSGNVFEWCSDWYGGAYSSSSQSNPKGASSGSYRVLRGGCWSRDAGYCRSSNRYYGSPDFRYFLNGFRLAL